MNAAMRKTGALLAKDFADLFKNPTLLVVCLLPIAFMALGQPVSALLGETVEEPKADDVRALAERLEAVNLQLARQKEARRKVLRGILLAVAAATALSLAFLAVLGSPYLGWDLDDPEMAVAGTFFHAFEWVFVRAAPVVLIASVAGLCLMRKRS